MSWSDKGRQLKHNLARVNWYFCTGVLFLLSVLGTIAWGGFQLHNLLNDADALPIEAVALKGERVFTTDDEIKNALQSLMQNSFFSADVVDVQKALEALPWVYHASVRREWPAKFKVTLQEQQAVAHWNNTAWLNVNGEVFEALAHAQHATLPMLSGPEGTEQEVLTSFQQLNDLLTINGFTLVNLRLSPRHAWHAVLANGIEIELGREDKMSRIQRFINVYPTLKQSNKPVATVDLRYDTGFAVGWDDPKQRADNK
ncbi:MULTISPECIES: cell division protein FtsQ/DivIB [Shewanella]|uniref:Cell division protein FtsQ n=2 Tax=Shewanella TaxID=22 RepID=A0ABQ2Q544_9GAMM|nr:MULTISPECIES: cell division protein FtsQ/DivIB [Shewanella]MCL1101915.1 cell division protein FtsQ/DivIB [Shewanella saliphila]MCT8988036.1 cell division protein FtsQ/DivIB [Shewanella sp. KJ10-1]GGP51883.1 cell division protein FtsQ [Shewanella saliphila]